MAKLARKVGDGLDAVLAMTGNKDVKLADHYSKCTEDDRIMKHIRSGMCSPGSTKLSRQYQRVGVVHASSDDEFSNSWPQTFSPRP